MCLSISCPFVHAQPNNPQRGLLVDFRGQWFGIEDSPCVLQRSVDGNSLSFTQVRGAIVNDHQWPNAFYGSATELAVAMGDLDADGDLDMVRGSRYRVEWIRNTGSPASPDWEPLQWGNIVPDENAFWTPALVDIDADGDLDLFCGRLDGTLSFFPNVGDTLDPVWGMEQANYLGMHAGHFSVPSFCDIDADGDEDLFLGCDSGLVSLFRNTGSPSAPAFSLDTAFHLVTSTLNALSPHCVDIDEDGDYDLMIATAFGRILYFQNQGTPDSAIFHFESSDYAGISLGWTNLKCGFYDLDADSDNDMLLTDLNGASHFYRNKGTTAAPLYVLTTDAFCKTLQFGRNSAPAIGDIDADGDLDIVIGTHVISILENDGTPETLAWYWFTADHPVSLERFWLVPELADINADGDLELFAGSVYGELYYFNNIGTAAVPNWSLVTPHFAGISFGNNSHVAPTLADIDNDGDLDLFVEHYGTYDSLIFIRNVGTPTDTSWELVDSNYLNISSHGISFANCDFGDLDNDGDLDCIFGDAHPGKFHYFENKGTPTSPDFEYVGEISTGLGVEGETSYSSPRLADFNNDGKLDLVAGLEGGGLNFWYNTTAPAVGMTGSKPLQPDRVTLEQNYPNPFNPTTTLRYTIPGVVAPSGVEGRLPSHVRLAVYDLLGREAAVLVDGRKDPGAYAVTWDATGMPSGVYFCRLTAGNHVESRKMVLMK